MILVEDYLGMFLLWQAGFSSAVAQIRDDIVAPHNHRYAKATWFGGPGVATNFEQIG